MQVGSRPVASALRGAWSTARDEDFGLSFSPPLIGNFDLYNFVWRNETTIQGQNRKIPSTLQPAEQNGEDPSLEYPRSRRRAALRQGSVR